jgi:chloramphenicol-sensitive protein RarD
LALRRGFPALGALLATRGVLVALLGTSALIGCNWGVYVYSVVSGHISEASLGYFLNPIVNVVFGAWFLGERLRPTTWAAVGLAASGTAWFAWGIGGLPWISLVLALTFALYGLFRKVMGVPALEGLLVETALLAPLAAGWITWITWSGTAAFGQGDTAIWLLLAGAVTTGPLLAFVGAARRLPLQVLGFAQYLSPTIQLGLAVLVYHEGFDFNRAVTFGLVGAGVLVFVGDLAWRSRG